MGDGTKENPYTREDVLRLIKKNGGTAAGLDLSGKYFVDGIDLIGFNLEGIILKEAILWDMESVDLEREDPTAGLEGAHLEGTSLMYANLEGVHILASHLEGADLFNANLKNALLTGAHLEGANLSLANLEGAKMREASLEKALLAGIKLSNDTILTDVKWGNYVLLEEIKAIFTVAEITYRQLKMWYSTAGIYDVAGEFFYREMEAKRKQVQESIQEQFEKCKGWRFLVYLCKEKDFGNWIRLWIYRLIFGYGEKPWRVVIWGISVLLGSTLLYFFLRGVAPHTLTAEALLSSLYYSAVSFTALGYGPWFSTGSVRSWAQGVGAAEAIIGVFTIALFLVTFTRKMTR